MTPQTRIVVDVDRRSVKVDGMPIRLTNKEFALLVHLARAEGRIVSRDEILESVWGHGKDADIDTRTVDQHWARMRRKLNAVRDRFVTVPLAGYQVFGVTFEDFPEVPALDVKKFLTSAAAMIKRGQTLTIRVS